MSNFFKSENQGIGLVCPAFAFMISMCFALCFSCAIFLFKSSCCCLIGVDFACLHVNVVHLCIAHMWFIVTKLFFRSF